MKKFVAGIVVGATLMLGSTVFADQIKQYILTAASYPIFVNGKEYADPERPILNYEGSTYVPLAKLGDLTGVNYKWNESLQRVEIDTKSAQLAPETEAPKGTGSPGGSSSSNQGSGLPQGGVLTPDVEVVKSTTSGFFTRDGVTYYEAFDRDGNRLGVYKDEDDQAYTSAKLEGRKDLPPRLSEGWMQGGFLLKVYKMDMMYDGSDIIFFPEAKKDTDKPVEIYRLNLPTDWRKSESGETTVNGVKVKRDHNTNFFWIEDLKKVGIIG